jgi:drug/metabolite transporter (DMT)-like permease
VPARPSAQALGVLLVIVSACGFGSGALLVQPLYEQGIDPQVVLYWRFTTAALLAWAFVLLGRRGRASLRALPRRRIAVLALLGAIYVGNSFGFYASLLVVPITLSSIITYIYPALVAVMATRLVRRLEGRRAWLALGISLFGVALALGGVPAGDLPPVWGLALAVASPVIYAAWIVLQSRVAGDRPRRRGADVIDVPPADAQPPIQVPDPAPATAVMTTSTAAVFALLVLVTGGSISPADVPADAWPPLLAIGLVAGAIAMAAFYAGVRRIGGARAALVSTVEPVYTIVMAMLLFGERLTPIQFVGGALVIGAVILAETGRRQDREPREPREPRDSPTVAGAASR